MAGVFVPGTCRSGRECESLFLAAAAILEWHPRRDTFGETTMNQPLLAALIAGALMSCTSFEARAQERAGDAALGALSGAVVLGPVGAVAGAFIGYTAGPSIARSWGVRRSASSSRARRASRGGATTQGQSTAIASAPPPVISAEAPQARQGTAPVQAAAKQGAPPVQPLE